MSQAGFWLIANEFLQVIWVYEYMNLKFPLSWDSQERLYK